MKKIIWKFFNLLKIGGPIQLYIDSQLKEDGWFNSFYKKESVDKNSNPLPWYTYPFIKFIDPRLSNDFTVFEYGSGNSTLWISKRVKFIKSVEHNKNWYEKVKNTLPPNAELVFKESNDNLYAKEVNVSGSKYDIIIIDGIDRNECVYESVKSINEKGIIIFDNSERKDYNKSISYLLDNGFKKLDFWGIGPVTSINSCTSVFYKGNNCLNI